MQTSPTLDDIRAAARRIRMGIHRTPILTCRSIDAMVGGNLWFKCENLQRTGAFKIRGATNAVLSLGDDAAARGVATHSSGNHGAALAFAACARGIPAYVVMPENAPRVKRDAVTGYGARVLLCESTLAARERSLAEVVEETGAVFIPPYNDERVIAGQATAALELLQDTSGLDIVMTPIGGGGLTSGTALVVKALSPGTRMIAAEPLGADDAYRSFHAGHIVTVENPTTVADGLRTSLGDKTFPILREFVDEVVTVSEEAIIAAMRTIWERMKILVEPSAAVPLGAILGGDLEVRGKRVGVVLSGGNVDLDRLPWR